MRAPASQFLRSPVTLASPALASKKRRSRRRRRRSLRRCTRPASRPARSSPSHARARFGKSEPPPPVEEEPAPSKSIAEHASMSASRPARSGLLHARPSQLGIASTEAPAEEEPAEKKSITEHMSKTRVPACAIARSDPSHVRAPPASAPRRPSPSLSRSLPRLLVTTSPRSSRRHRSRSRRNLLRRRSAVPARAPNTSDPSSRLPLAEHLFGPSTDAPAAEEPAAEATEEGVDDENATCPKM